MSSQEVVLEEKGADQKEKIVAAEWVDPSSKPMVMVRKFADGEEKRSVLEKGEGGFCIAKFGDEIVETEVPCLLLEPPLVVRTKHTQHIRARMMGRTITTN